MEKLQKTQLEELSRVTVSHYDEKAESFWEGTRDHDVSQNIEALLSLLGPAPQHILDLGCGPGRDLLAFKRLGHHPVGLDASDNFCEMAKKFSGCPVLNQNFLSMDLEDEYFDGIFANASLFHVPLQELSAVLISLRKALKPGGVLFSSNPRGQDVEGWSGDRYGSCHSLKGWTRQLTAAGFEAAGHYYRPTGRPREEQPWLASLWRKNNLR